MTTVATPRRSARMRRVNDLISECLEKGDRVGPVAFFCECGREGCFHSVWLTPVEYEQGRREPDWAAVAPLHLAATGTDV